MNEFQEKLDKIQPSGELGPDDKQAGIELLTDLVSDVYLTNIEHVKTIKERPPNELTGEELPSGIYKLELTQQLEYGVSLRVIVQSWTGDYREANFDKDIQVQEVDPSGFTRHACRFYIGEDGVRRYEVDDAKRLAREVPSRVFRIDIVPEYIQKSITCADIQNTDDTANVQLERQFGLNNTPVGPDEIAQLAELISAAKPVENTGQ